MDLRLPLSSFPFPFLVSYVGAEGSWPLISREHSSHPAGAKRRILALLLCPCRVLLRGKWSWMISSESGEAVSSSRSGVWGTLGSRESSAGAEDRAGGLVFSRCAQGG